jgi:hypothetical protein
MDDITKTIGAGLRTPITKEAEEEALKLARLTQQAEESLSSYLKPQTPEDADFIKRMARSQAEGEVREAAEVARRTSLPKPKAASQLPIAEEAIEKTAKEAMDIGDKRVTEDILRKFRSEKAKDLAKAAVGKVGKTTLKFLPVVGAFTELMDQGETVSEEQEMAELERLKQGDNALAKRNALEKLRSPASKK